MKNISYIIIAIVVILNLSCEYDNYDPPQISYSGQLTYKDEPFIYDGNPSQGLIKFVQSGYGKVDNGTGVRINEEGYFNQLLFGGDYDLTLENNPYPFEFKDFSPLGAGQGYDTIPVSLNSDVSNEFPVTPYYEISNVEAGLSGLDVVATFKVNKVAGTTKPAPAIVKARLYLSTSTIVNSATTAVGETSVNITDNGEIRVPISVISYRNAYKNNFRDYAFYRVALELEGIPNYYLFSDVNKVENIPLEFNDITSDYMKNFKQEFEIETWFNDRRGKVADWNVSSAIEPTMYDGWGDRKFMGAENWGGPIEIKGGVWQTISLPAGKYVFLAKRGWNSGDLTGGENRAFLGIAEGENLAWDSTFIGKADLGLKQNGAALSISFELAQEKIVSLGYVIDFPAGEYNAASFSSFSIIKTE